MNKAYLADEAMRYARQRIVEAFLNFTTDSSEEELHVIDEALAQIDDAYRRLVPIHDGPLIGYQDCAHHLVRWWGIAFDEPVVEVYSVPQE